MTCARHWRIVRFAPAPTLFAAFTAACFIFGHGKAAPQPEGGALEGEVALNVINHNYLDVVIYVLHHGVRTRVGTVTGSTSAVFLLPARLLGQGREIQLRGYPIGAKDTAFGGQNYAFTETLIVQQGQYIEWTLETDLHRSSVAVY
jgi:hypothetical protein